MDVFDITYGITAEAPKDLTLKETEITTYTWPGFLAELEHDTGMFVVWELCGSNTWLRRTDIYAPPADCIGVSSAKVRRAQQEKSQWTLWEHCWRRVQPKAEAQPQLEVPTPLPSPPLLSLLALCGPAVAEKQQQRQQPKRQPTGNTRIAFPVVSSDQIHHVLPI
jgi:hypothetical protein